MLALPSVWNLIISTAVFFMATFCLGLYFDDAGLQKGMVRSLLVFLLGSLISCGSGELVDWVNGKIDPPKAEANAPTPQVKLYW